MESTISVARMKLSKAGLASMPAADRALLLLVGHAINEINVLHKTLLAMLRESRSEDRELTMINHGQALIVVRLLIGKLHEAWELFRRRVQRSKVASSEYLPQLTPSACEHVQHLNRHFGAGSPLSSIRNKLSFHSCDEDNLLEVSFAALAESEPWNFYLGHQVANTFYYASELVMTKTASDLAGGFDALFSITLDVAGSELSVLEELMVLIVSRHFPDTEAQEQLVAAPPAKDIRLPFFVDLQLQR